MIKTKSDPKMRVDVDNVMFSYSPDHKTSSVSSKVNNVKPMSVPTNRGMNNPKLSRTINLTIRFLDKPKIDIRASFFLIWTSNNKE